MTRDLALRAGVDHGNRSMHAAGRTAWDEENYNAAILMFNTLWPLCPHRIAPDDCAATAMNPPKKAPHYASLLW